MSPWQTWGVSCLLLLVTLNAVTPQLLSTKEKQAGPALRRLQRLATMLASARKAPVLPNTPIAGVTTPVARTAKAGSGDKATVAGSGDKATPAAVAGSGDKIKTAGSGEKATPAGSGENATPAGSGEKATPAGSGDKATVAGSGEKATPAPSVDKKKVTPKAKN